MSDGDIAKLGIEIDTQPVKAATQDLKGLGDQAGKTADQGDKIGAALGKATAPAGDLSSKLRDGAAAATAYARPQSAIEKAQIGVDTVADKHVTYANTSEKAAKQTAALTAAIGTVGSIMQGNLATADEEKKALDALGISFQNTGTLSVSVFRAIQAESPSTALAISRAFGYDKVSEF